MCIDVKKTCECGTSTVRFHLKDNVMLPEVVTRVFCPSCPGDTPFDGQTMLQDNGWTIEYDMILAKFLAGGKLTAPADEVTPEFLFDNGYACWLEMYPGEQEAIRAEKEQLLLLQKKNQNEYLAAISSWNIDRINKIKAAGWRKALQA